MGFWCVGEILLPGEGILPWESFGSFLALDAELNIEFEPT